MGETVVFPSLIFIDDGEKTKLNIDFDVLHSGLPLTICICNQDISHHINQHCPSRRLNDVFYKQIRCRHSIISVHYSNGFFLFLEQLKILPEIKKFIYKIIGMLFIKDMSVSYMRKHVNPFLFKYAMYETTPIRDGKQKLLEEMRKQTFINSS